jgi:hypothetical protein
MSFDQSLIHFQQKNYFKAKFSDPMISPTIKTILVFQMPNWETSP